MLQAVHEGQNDTGNDTSSSNNPEIQPTTIDGPDVNTTKNDSARPINKAGSDDNPESNKDESPGEFESHSQIPCL